MTNRPTLSMVLPAYNEERNIDATVKRSIAAAQKHFGEFEIIVVDDGSADATSAVVEKIAAADSRVKIIKHPNNIGYGAALRSGFSNSKYDWVFFMDSDGQFDPEDMSLLVPHLNDYDVVAGFRMKRQDNGLRRFLGWTFSRSAEIFFHTGLKDVDCAFKFFKGDMIRSLPLESERSLINTEIFFHAHRLKWKIKQVGVNHYPRTAGEQTGASVHVIGEALQKYWRLFFKLHTR